MGMRGDRGKKPCSIKDRLKNRKPLYVKRTYTSEGKGQEMEKGARDRAEGKTFDSAKHYGGCADKDLEQTLKRKHRVAHMEKSYLDIYHQERGAREGPLLMRRR